MSPRRRPSGRRFTALQEPATRTAGVTSSTSATTLTLCGIVISAPRTFSRRNTPRSTSAKFSGLHPMGTTSALAPIDSK